MSQNKCTRSWRAIGYENIANGPFTNANDCVSTDCNIESNGNFLRFGSEDIFETARIPQYLADGTTLKRI